MTPRKISQPKGFQQATVEAALATLTAMSGPRRFLVADEVGLGKTVVARTIVSEMMKPRRSPLVVFYVSSNLNIAHQNKAKLLELMPDEAEEKQASAKADRLTLVANPAKRPNHRSLHLYTLTPDTSIPLYRRRGGFGRLEERALIFRLLTGRFPSLDCRSFAQQFRGRQAREASWKKALRLYEQVEGIRDLQQAFLDALARDKDLNLTPVNAESILAAAEHERPFRFMGCLRTALAMAALRDIQPDLVIFDEFQRFRELLIDPPNVTPDPVVRALRGGLHSGPAVLLLSATPYRAYTSRQEETAGSSHHQDFFELIRFLFGSDTEAPKKVEQAFRDFGRSMLAKETPDFELLGTLRERIEENLRPVLSRTERPTGMSSPGVSNHPQSEILSADLRVFKHWVARLQAARANPRSKRDLISFAVPYWLSVPLPIQMLGRGYVAWRLAEKRQRRRDEPTLRRTQRDRLNAPKSWPHPQLRVLSQIASRSRLALPWIAPSLPWWELRGSWSGSGASEGKLLIFSRFKAVPPALASLLSFGLESSFAHDLRYSYRRAGLAQPLQFKADRPTLPALFFPSPTLISLTDPRRDGLSTLPEVRNSMRRQVHHLLRDRLGIPVKRSGGQRPLWKLLPALEHTRAIADRQSTLPSWAELRYDWRRVAATQAEAIRNVLDQCNQSAEAGLTWITQSEVAALAEFALSGPGVVLGRALYRFDPGCIRNESYFHLLDASWNGLRSYLNRSLFHSALTRRGQTYVEAIPEAVVAGNLESVFDEHLWITSQLDANAVGRFPKDISKVLGLREGRHQVHEPAPREAGFFLRCHAAMPFTDAKVAKALTGSEDRLRTDDLRRSFNSPFWPHVLTTTSLGQEGLDFHVWCRQLLHWDLCATPVDFEQREGRIQRFGGLSVRRTLVGSLGRRALSEAGERTSPWTVLAAQAENEFRHDASGLRPWWSCPGETIDRLFVVLPQSQQTHRFDQLIRQRWLYRMALGQPHQQDFIERVSQLPDDGRQEFALRLSAWEVKERVPELHTRD